jgi:energy-converting hydrogenase Eha subunit E
MQAAFAAQNKRLWNNAFLLAISASSAGVLPCADEKVVKSLNVSVCGWQSAS